MEKFKWVSFQHESEVRAAVTGVITVSFCGLLFFGLLINLLKSRTGFKEIDKTYGKPYMAKLVKIHSDHPALKRGSMAISLHPKGAIAFNRKVFLFTQISSIKIIPHLPEKFKNGQKMAVNSGVEEQYLCIAVSDEYGEHEVVFTTKSDFRELATQLIQKWTKYNLLV